ncbi:hypothetical protein BUALT_Bualt15G0121500 [Buddleja alternifolia]|uniref:Inositol-tetrakisphosphate 1-kinase n=1 Tax=Buddleja alternifolia TaxID=168488 RepID=A0AAV6WMA3_9LAMI|nr:hypothetical protein BUALT_Bualt15G0121500 [Buddleja alternifolia]
MRMIGEIAFSKEDEKDEVEVAEEDKMYTVGEGAMKVVVVGYALTTKKIKSFLQPKFERLARNKGILFVAIDQNRPLSDQGPFDIVLHKCVDTFFLHRLLRSYLERNGGEFLRGLLLLYHDFVNEVEALRFQERGCCPTMEFLADYQDYRKEHPEVTVLDPPDAIQQVHNRQSMLQDVADLNLSDPYGKVGVPKQLVIKKDPSSIPAAVSKAGLRLPLVAKPLVAKSHELSLAFDEFSLQKLEPPLVLQEFINHGGVLFKVYIVGEAIKVVRRFSLPDVSKRELSKNAGVYRFPRVSSAAASADEADLDPCVAELPPRPLLERLARELRRRLGLRLFNLDIIREHGSRDHYYVIDINYFPGYGKMPEYEHIFTDFLLSLVQTK